MRTVLKAAGWIVVVAVVIGALVVAMRPAPVGVDVERVSRGPMAVRVEEEGRTRIRERYVVSSPLTGRLGRVELDPGDAVRGGETVLATIEPTDPDLLDARALAAAEARVRAAEAAVRRAGAASEQARATYDLAEDDRARLQEAFDEGGASRQELARARSEEDAAREALRAARLDEEIATWELEVARSAVLFARGEAPEEDGAATGGRLALRSPIDGAVLRVLQESAAVVAPGTPLLEVGDPRDLEVVVDVLSTDAVRIEPGQRVSIERWGGPAPLAAVVRRVEPSAFTKVSALGIDEQRVNVVADFTGDPEARAALGDGFRVEAAIVTWEAADVLRVPSSAVFRRGAADATWAVFVLGDDGRARRREISVGMRNGTTMEVTQGLDEGESVIVHPSDRLTDGVRARVREPSAGIG